MIDLERSPLEVAPELLGAVLSHAGVSVRLTEVEAYLSDDDPASHAFRGVTARTRVMFGPPSTMYVYLSYGIHLAANVVCRPEGTAGAVLLRSGEVVAGHELARERRQAARRPGSAPVPDHQLARGPGCLGQALALTIQDSGAALRQATTPGANEDGAFVLVAPDERPAAAVLSGPRVGISEAADHPWRFWLAGEPSVSSYSRSSRALPDGTPGRALRGR